MATQAEWLRVNGLLGDPSIHVFFAKTGDSILFDLGSIDALANRDLLKVRAAFVSHTHVDHFIGFDRWLRINVPHFRELEIAGPPGILANVRGKLAGYTWNLLEPDQVRFVVHEVGVDGSVTTTRLRNQTGFAPEPLLRPAVTGSAIDAPLPSAPGTVVTMLADGTRIEAVSLDHGTPSIAYAVQSPCRFQTRTDHLEALGLKPGAWIRDLQMAIAERRLQDTITIDGRSFIADDLARQIFDLHRPKALGYVTDIGFTRANLDRAAHVLSGVATLVSETNYRDAEADKARDKMHLTTRQAALLAAHVGAEKLEIFHISNLYATDPLAVVQEAEEFFAKFRACQPQELAEHVEAELRRF